MSHYLHLSFRLFDAMFHGRRDGGELEWPPSPLRAFQALVAAAGQRWRKDRLFDAYARDPLAWLEGLGLPDLIAPAGVPTSSAYRLYVPNNHADIVAAAWSGGDPLASIAEHRVEKDVRSTRLIGGETVHYLWPITPDRTEHIRVLDEIAREVSHLGWGADQAASSFRIAMSADVDGFIGERWIPAVHGGTLLRVPQPAGPTTGGTLADLRRKHADFVARLGPNGFKPVPPLSAYRVVGYRRATDPASLPFAAFSLLKPDGSGFRPFVAARWTTVVAGMVRHALDRVAKIQGWTDEERAAIVHGHAAPDDEAVKLSTDAPRFSYLPLPSIERRPLGDGVPAHHVGMIRRVIVAGRPGMAKEIAWARRALSGAELIDEKTGEVKALLSMIPDNDWGVRQYVRASSSWTTVTPVIVPGYDDRRAAKTERLIRKALEQAGVSAEMAGLAQLEWRGVGFLPGLDLASRYRRPRNVSEAPVRHVRVRWRDQRGDPIEMPGPLAVGSGRFRGLGLFVSDGSDNA